MRDQRRFAGAGLARRSIRSPRASTRAASAAISAANSPGARAGDQPGLVAGITGEARAGPFRRITGQCEQSAAGFGELCAHDRSEYASKRAFDAPRQRLRQLADRRCETRIARRNDQLSHRSGLAISAGKRSAGIVSVRSGASSLSTKLPSAFIARSAPRPATIEACGRRAGEPLPRPVRARARDWRIGGATHQRIR